ncbi:MAG: hypothetical protein ABL984_15335 [Pyrinomonadaceae bacterium]
MKITVFRYLVLLSLLMAAGSIYAQSSDQMFPTPVRTSEIASSIKARAIGDPRVTTYYYTFEGEQGDVFVNVQSKNFTGDIDVYIVPSQQPLTKIVIYGDQPEAETGRVVYLRKPERLLLRIQGRAPGDEDASVLIKFAGSFIASKLDDSSDPAVPKVESSAETNVRVNSVGTILEVIPKATPTPAAIASNLDEISSKTESVPEVKEEAPKEEESASKESRTVEVVVTDPIKVEEKRKETAPRHTNGAANRRVRRTVQPRPAIPAGGELPGDRKEGTSTPAEARKSVRRQPPVEKKPEPPKVDPMVGINLVIYFKDGSRIDRPMTEVMRFSVERAVLTVISKNGTIGRYNMTEVSRVSIE